ncbi:hypothetical protein B0H14DRAFT_3495251 [Mycena olivaceomarginata]|nr:hypothetical protein B0H14DRAFT_3495251 [Mycena olivaceomarginata]
MSQVPCSRSPSPASNAQPIPLNEQSSKHPGALSHHRRLSSTGRRRRLSDARDAASRPLSVGSPGLSMAALTLSTSASPPSSAVAHAMPASAPAKSSTPIPIAQPAAAAAAAGARKKRGVDHKCEACSKVGLIRARYPPPSSFPSLSHPHLYLCSLPPSSLLFGELRLLAIIVIHIFFLLPPS